MFTFNRPETYLFTSAPGMPNLFDRLVPWLAESVAMFSRVNPLFTSITSVGLKM